MKILLLLLSFSCFGALTESERSHLRQMSLKFCECRGGTYAILFDKEQPLAKVFCKNDESRVFYLNEEYRECK